MANWERMSVPLSLPAQSVLNVRPPHSLHMIYFNPCWSHIVMEFVTGLPCSDGKTTIFRVIDCFSKSVHLIPFVKLPSTKENAGWSHMPLNIIAFQLLFLTEPHSSSLIFRKCSVIWLVVLSVYPQASTLKGMVKLRELTCNWRPPCSAWHQRNHHPGAAIYPGWSTPLTPPHLLPRVSPFDCCLGYQPPCYLSKRWRLECLQSMLLSAGVTRLGRGHRLRYCRPQPRWSDQHRISALRNSWSSFPRETFHSRWTLGHWLPVPDSSDTTPLWKLLVWAQFHWSFPPPSIVSTPLSMSPILNPLLVITSSLPLSTSLPYWFWSVISW